MFKKNQIILLPKRIRNVSLFSLLYQTRVIPASSRSCVCMSSVDDEEPDEQRKVECIEDMTSLEKYFADLKEM